MYDSMDSGIRRMISEAKKAQDALNSASPVSEEKIQEVILELNSDWGSLGLYDTPVAVSGKLRPTPDAIEQDVIELADGQSIPGLLDTDEDLQGNYVTAANFSCIIRGLTVEEEEEPLGTLYSVVFEISLDEDYSDDEIWFTLQPDEIEYIFSEHVTEEGAADFIKTHLPEVYAAIEALPSFLNDAEQLRKALDDFSITIDPKKLDTDLGLEEIIDMIESHLTDHLGIDNTAFTATVDGVIYGRGTDNSLIDKHWQGKLKQLLVGRVRLCPDTDIDGDMRPIQYRPLLETWYLVPEHGGSRTEITIPIDNLVHLKCMRPNQADYPFSDRDTTLVPNEDIEGRFNLKPLDSLTKEKSSDSTNDHSTSLVKETKAEVDRTELLKSYLESLRELHRKVKPFASGDNGPFYEPGPELMAARDIVADIAEEFLKQHNKLGLNPDIEVTGEGLRFPSSKTSSVIDRSKGQLIYKVEGDDIVKGNIFSNFTGSLCGFKTATYEVGGKFALKANLIFFDKSTIDEPLQVFDSLIKEDVLYLKVDRKFTVDFSDEVDYDLVELKEKHKMQEALESIEKAPISQKNLNKVKEILEDLAISLEERSTEWIKYYSVEDLNEIGFITAGNEKASDAVSYALETAIGTGRPLRLSGSYFDSESKRQESGEIEAMFEGSIARHPLLKTPEPVLVLWTIEHSDNKKSKTVKKYIFPISALEEMHY